MSEEKKIGISNSDRAHVLVQAMPYIKKWRARPSSSNTAATP